MKVAGKVPQDLQDALSKGVLNRLPLTFLSFVNQQLHQWEYLFPNEQQSTERLLLHVASLNQEQSSALFRDVVELEEKMGIRHWHFSTSEQTIQNSSELARSPYFREWRQAVQVVFDAADQHALATKGVEVKAKNRLVLLEIPRPLSLDASSAWRRWQGIGRPLKLDLGSLAQHQSPLDFLVSGKPGSVGGASAGLLNTVQSSLETPTTNAWLVDAGKSLVDSGLGQPPSVLAAPKAVMLSYERLDLYRQSFSHEMNTMRKDLADADAIYDRLRKIDVAPWCPPEVAVDPAVREFLRSLYLTGNGAVIFGNSFVEWAASEAFRRARPTFLAAKFGVRSKPKPFTGVAVFDEPDRVNPLPAVDDLPGSAVDAQMLALYVWLAANRYEEYRHSTVCVCLAESISQAYVVAPPEFDLRQQTGPLPLDRLSSALQSWMAQTQKES
jgi:hypothetical protein